MREVGSQVESTWGAGGGEAGTVGEGFNDGSQNSG